MRITDLFENILDQRKFLNLFQSNTARCKREYPEEYELYTFKEPKERKSLIKDATPYLFVGPRMQVGAPLGKPHNYPENINKWRNRLRRLGLPDKSDTTSNPEHKITHANPKGAGRPHDPIKYEERHAQESKIYEMMQLLDGSIEFSNVPGFYESKWSPTEKLYAMCAWLVTGSAAKASLYCGIPAGTIAAFKKQEWWVTCLDSVRQDSQGDLDLALTRVIHKGAELILDRFENGDIKPIKIGNEIKYVSHPVTARDTAMTVSMMADKRALMRGDPTSRVEKSTNNLKELAKEFAKFTNAKTIEGETE